MSRTAGLSIAIVAGLLLGSGIGYLFSLNNPGSAVVAVPVFALAMAPALAAAAWMILNRRHVNEQTKKNEQNVERAWSNRASGWSFTLLVCALVAGSMASNIFNLSRIDPIIYVVFGLAAHGFVYLVIKRKES